MRYLFIVGCQRSGTTWLGWLLAQHPEAVVSLHTGFFRHLDHMFDWLHRPTQFGNRVLGGNSGQAKANGTAGSAVPLRELISEAALYAACRPLAEELYRGVAAAKPGATLVVEKTPEHLLNGELIRAVLPEARFLHVVRDPRAVFASMRSASKQWAYPGDFPSSPIYFVRRRWLRYQEAWDRLSPVTDQYAAVRYEDFLDDGPGQLRRLFDWLELPADEAFCQQAIKACSLERLRSDAAAPEGFFRRGQADSWREELSARQIRIIEHLARDRMEALGYHCETERSQRPPLRIQAFDLWGAGIQRLTSGPLRGPVQKLLAKARLRRDWQR